MSKSEKISSLTKHLEKIKNQMSTPPAKYTKTPESLAGYRQWCKIEINKTEQKLNELKTSV